MKPTRPLEPGVIPTFRLFIGIQFVITLLGVITHWFIAPFSPPAAVVSFTLLSLLEPGLLFLYLWIPALPRLLKSVYLPIGIVWAAAGPIIDPYFSLMNLHAGEIMAPSVLTQVALWRQIILLLIPLVVISWQYTIREIALFCVLTTAANIVLLSRIVPFPTMISSSLLGIAFAQMVIFFLVGHLIEKMMTVQREQRQHLTKANERLAQSAFALEQLTISRERIRMARELHDLLAHTLSGVAVEMEGARAMLRLDPERANSLLNHSLQAVREGLTETRRALKELRTKALDDLGLALAVQALVESYASRFDLQIFQDIEPAVNDFPLEVQQCVYRIAQEALANVATHAQAKNVHVILKVEQAQLLLSVLDDGCGFHVNQSIAEGHYGLLGMRERTEMVGGCLQIESQPGKGTQITFSYRIHIEE
jgi:signal transduction histidine kinase